MTVAPTLSVVITAHNAAATIGPCLRSVAAQRGLAPGALEIVLVDDRSTDGTLDAARRAGLGDELRLIRIDAPGGSTLTTRQQALAIAFDAARGEVALTVDADGIVDPHWVERLSAPILAGRADAVAGAVSFRAARGWLGAWQTVDQSVYISICRILAGLGFDSGVLFGNFAFRRVLFRETGGFDSIGHTLTEDLAFARALSRHGARIEYEARADVDVEAVPSWSVLIERAKRVSAGGVSAISVAIGLWMGSLVLLALGALVFGSGFAAAFWLRYGLGVAHAAYALVRARQARLIPLAFLYEPLAIAIGLVVAVKLFGNGTVEWGGRRYER